MDKKIPPVDLFLTYSLAAAYQRVHRQLAKRLKSMGTQIEAWRILHCLRTGRKYTMTELAETVLMNPPSLTKLVDRMVSNGLVQRQLVAEDQRQVHLALTDLGVAFLDETTDHVKELERKIVLQIGKERVEALRETLDTLN